WLSLSTGGAWHVPTLLISAGTILLIVSVRRFNGWLRSHGARFPIPQHLLAVTVMAVAAWALDLGGQGVRLVGTVPAGLPHFQVPALSWEWTQQFLGN